MSVLKIELPFPVFTDVDGNPLEDGYIYIGESGKNPEGFPIDTWWDSALSVPAVQPVRTIGGYASRSGTPGKLYINSLDYSITARNKNNTLVWSTLTVSGVPSTVAITVEDVAEAQLILPTAGASIIIRSADGNGRVWTAVTGLTGQSNNGGTFAGTQIAYDTTAVWRAENYSFGSVSVIEFGAIGDGIADDTVAIQAALDASLYITFPAGRYLISATLIAQAKSKLEGAGAEKTILQRTANYGDTIQIGTVATGANNFEISGLWFYKPQVYTAGVTTTITYPVTAGAAHLAVVKGQRGAIHDCFFWGMPYGITVESTSLLWITRNNFNGIWDHLIAGLQEGLVSIYLKSDGATSNTLVTINGNHIGGGYFSESRDVTVGSTTFSTNEQIGPRYGVSCESCEGLHIYDNYLGGQSDYSLHLNVKQIIASVKVYGNFFDTGLIGAIQAITTSASHWVVGLQIIDNNINGQLVGLEALRIDYPASFKSVVGLVMIGNRIENFLKTPITLVGVVGATITSNAISNYNARNSATGDPDYSSGIRVFAGALKVFATLNTYGGGTNDLSATNNCQWGIFFNATTLGYAINESEISLGLAGGTLIGGGFWQNNKRLVIHTDVGNYAISGIEDIVIINKTVGATTQIAPPAGVDVGYVVKFKDGKGDASVNLLQFVGTVDGVLNPTYATNYVSKTVVWNGTEWNDIS